MSTRRRNAPPNRWGCKPTEDVCVEHDMPLECRHGCESAAPHKCCECEVCNPGGPQVFIGYRCARHGNAEPTP